MQFCFVHAADLHLDTPFQGVGATAPELAERLRDASLATLENLVDLTIRNDAVFLLLAGDIYDGSERGIRAQFRFRDAMKRLDDKHIPVFLAHGNHDPLDGWSAIRNWPVNVTLFSSSAVESHAVMRAGKRIANIYGISYGMRDISENLAVRFRREPVEGLHVGLLHCNVGGSDEHARYSPCTVDDLARAGMDYWALGHIHTRRIFQAGRALAAYSGSTQGRSFKPSEQGPKGALVVTASEAGIVGTRFEAIDQVRFAEFQIDIAKLEDWGSLSDALEEKAQALRNNADGRDLIVRATLSGRGVLHRDLNNSERIAALLTELRQQSDGEEGFLHWASLSNETRGDIDVAALRGRGDFAAELVARVDTLELDSSGLEAFGCKSWNHAKAHLLTKWLPVVDSTERAELLHDAQRKALEMVLDRMEPEAGS